jgi:hypothetical protein
MPFKRIFYVLAALALYAALSLLGGVLAPFLPIYDLVAIGYGYLLWAAWQNKPITLPLLGAFARKQSTPSAQDNHTVQ